MSRQQRVGNGPVWAFEKMWNKPHYNQGTYISNAPGYSDATGDFLQDPPVSNESDGPVWHFDPMWNKVHYNEGDYVSDAPGVDPATGDFLDIDENNGKITATHQPWCAYWYKGSLDITVPVVPVVSDTTIYPSPIIINIDTLGTGYEGVVESAIITINIGVSGSPNASFITDFSEYTLEVEPADWTRTFHSADTPPDMTYKVVDGDGTYSTQTLNPTRVATDRCGLQWDTVGTPTDVEILTRVKKPVGSVINYTGVFARGDATTNETCVALMIRDDTNNGYSLRCYVDGTTTESINPIVAITEDVYYWIRLRVVGSLAYGKIWLASESEPASWHTSFNGVTVSATSAGYVGIFNYANGPINAAYDWFGVALDGATVALP